MQEVRENGIHQECVSSLVDVIATTDVLYVTRLQKERFENVAAAGGASVSTTPFIVDAHMMSLAKTAMVVLHPFPRNTEISKEVDVDPRAKYFKQMENGLYVRMALLADVMLQ